MTTGIIPNQQGSWYDPALETSDSVLIGQINYDGAGTDFSAAKTRVRLMQDMFRRSLPNCTRQGLGLSLGANQVDIAAGDAIIAGRWAWTDTGDNVSTIGLGTADYYLVWRVELAVTGKPPDAQSRDPQDETAVFDLMSISGYSPDEFELVLGKVTVVSDVPSFAVTTDKYTDIPDQWAVGRIVPRTKSADGQNSYSSVRIAYANGGVELIDQISTESYGARIFNKLQFDDQNDAIPVSIKNVDGVLMARNEGVLDNAYVPFDADSYFIDGVVVINNNREIDNVTILAGSTINGFTLAGNIVSTASRNIQLNDAGDLTLALENTGGGVAHFTADGDITAGGQIVSSGSPIGIASGGTGANTASLARTSLGLEIGADVQAYDAGLQSIAGLVEAANKMIYQTGAGAYAITNAATSAEIMVANSGGNPVFVGMSGDTTISNTGVVAIGATKVTNAMLAGSIANSKLAEDSMTILATNGLTGSSTQELGGIFQLEHDDTAPSLVAGSIIASNNEVIHAISYDTFGHNLALLKETRNYADWGAASAGHIHSKDHTLKQRFPIVSIWNNDTKGSGHPTITIFEGRYQFNNIGTSVSDAVEIPLPVLDGVITGVRVMMDTNASRTFSGRIRRSALNSSGNWTTGYSTTVTQYVASGSPENALFTLNTPEIINATDMYWFQIWTTESSSTDIVIASVTIEYSSVGAT